MNNKINKELDLIGKEFYFNGDTWKVICIFKPVFGNKISYEAKSSKELVQLFNCEYVRDCIVNEKFVKRLKGKTIINHGRKVEIIDFDKNDSRLTLVKNKEDNSIVLINLH